MYQSWQRSTEEVCINKPLPAAPAACSEPVCRWTAQEGAGVCVCLRGRVGRSLAYLLQKFRTKDGTHEPAFVPNRTSKVHTHTYTEEAHMPVNTDAARTHSDSHTHAHIHILH